MKKRNKLKIAIVLINVLMCIMLNFIEVHANTWSDVFGGNTDPWSEDGWTDIMDALGSQEAVGSDLTLYGALGSLCLDSETTAGGTYGGGFYPLGVIKVTDEGADIYGYDFDTKSVDHANSSHPFWEEMTYIMNEALNNTSGNSSDDRLYQETMMKGFQSHMAALDEVTETIEALSHYWGDRDYIPPYLDASKVKNESEAYKDAVRQQRWAGDLVSAGYADGSGYSISGYTNDESGLLNKKVTISGTLSDGTQTDILTLDSYRQFIRVKRQRSRCLFRRK